MSLLRSPLDAPSLPCVDDLVAALRPTRPVLCLRPAAIARDTAAFVAGFPGDVLYAVKCNPDPAVLHAVWDGGVRHFDCASLPEVALVRGMFPDAGIHFMHPVKSRPAIACSYAVHGVRDFVIDSAGELAKLLEETGNAGDLGIIVRIAVPAGQARYDLSGKFGASADEAAQLLRAARVHTEKLGISFHVGSQCMDPLAWRRAIGLAGEVIRASGVSVDVCDVGGGFPVRYPDLDPPPLGAFFAEIDAAVEALGMPAMRLWAEPGRALVAAGSVLVAQVLLRRGDALYINDGVYGSLSDAGAPGFRYPTRLLGRSAPAAVRDFELFGPTCDSADHMRGPFALPGDVGEGDWIEISQLGAYGSCLQTAFNGFERPSVITVR